VETYVKPESRVYTDEYPSYRALSPLYRHQTINHSIRKYARENTHINTCEGEFSLFNPFMVVHKDVAKYNMPLYKGLFQAHREVREMKLLTTLKHILNVLLF